MSDSGEKSKPVKTGRTRFGPKFQDLLNFIRLTIVLVHIKVLKNPRKKGGKPYIATRTFAVDRKLYNPGRFLPKEVMEAPVFRVDWTGQVVHKREVLLKNGAIRDQLCAHRNDTDSWTDPPSLIDTRSYFGNLRNLTHYSEDTVPAGSAEVVRVPKEAIDQIVVACAAGKTVWLSNGHYGSRVLFGEEQHPTGIYSISIPRIVEFGKLLCGEKWSRLILDLPTVELSQALLCGFNHFDSTAVAVLSCDKCNSGILGTNLDAKTVEMLDSEIAPPGDEYIYCPITSHTATKMKFMSGDVSMTLNTTGTGNHEILHLSHMLMEGMSQLANGIEIQSGDGSNYIAPKVDLNYHACLLSVPCVPGPFGEIDDISPALATIAAFDDDHRRMLNELLKTNKSAMMRLGDNSKAEVVVEIGGVQIESVIRKTEAPELSNIEVLRVASAML